MKRSIPAGLLIVLLAAAGLGAQPLPGVPVFGDDFGAPGLFVEHWDATRGASCADGRAVLPAGNSIGLRRIPEGNFAFTADLTVDKPAGADYGHCGAILDGIHFMITPASPPRAHTAYRVPGEERSRGNTAGTIPGLELGKPARIEVSRERLGNGYKYAYRVNGAPVDSFQVAMPATGKISFYGYKTSLSVDNFQLYSLRESDGSNNLAVNSSFEHLQEGMPLYMRPLLSGNYDFDGTWRDFIASFAIDTKEKVSGRQSARMTRGTSFPRSNGVGTFNVGVAAGTPVTFSAYLKASEDDFPVTLGIWELWSKGHSKPVRISREWRRYSFTVEKPGKAIVRGNISFDKPGTVWADDLQVEIGAEATPYMPSPLDRDKFAAGPAQTVPVAPDVRLRKMARTPVIDGTIEDAWFSAAAKLDRFFLNAAGDGVPANRTEAYVACDDENLYLAVRAHVADTSRVRAAERERDNLAAHGDDCIEVFLDTTCGRKTYYHLTTNAAGSRTDFGPGRVKAWDGDWTAAAKVNEQEKTIDYEMRFPLRNFAEADLSARWGVNIGRNDTSVQKVYSLTRAGEPNFHLPALFPAVVFPAGVVDKYRVGARDLRLVQGKDGSVSVAGSVLNLTGGPLDAEIVVGAGAAPPGRARARLAAGSTAVTVPTAVPSDTKALDAAVRILVAGKERHARTERLALSRAVETYTRWNYYMNEKAAVLVGSLNVPDAGPFTGRIAVAGGTFTVPLTPEFAVDVPLGNVPDGDHEIVLDVYAGSRRIAGGATRLVKRPFKEGAVRIDRQRRCLVVDGRPYLAITPFFGMPAGLKADRQDAVLKNMLRLHKEMGYRCFLLGGKDDPPFPGQTQAFIDLCAQNGIAVIYWPFQSWNRRNEVTPARRFEAPKGSAVIAWLIVDEPELYAKAEEVRAYMEAHRAANPYAPVFMNNTIVGIPGRYAGLATDILMLDDYLCNRENRKVVEMINATDMMWKAGEEDRLPVFYFLEGENLPNHYRECTYAEQMAQTYGVIIAGATGVSYFCSLPVYPEDYRACVQVNRELLALEGVIFSLEKTSPATVSNPAIRFMTRRLDGAVYVIALNTDNDRPAEAEIALPAEFGYAGNVEVMFESRRLEVRNGRIADTFKPLERHVYVVRTR